MPRIEQLLHDTQHVRVNAPVAGPQDGDFICKVGKIGCNKSGIYWSKRCTPGKLSEYIEAVVHLLELRRPVRLIQHFNLSIYIGNALL